MLIFQSLFKFKPDTFIPYYPQESATNRPTDHREGFTLVEVMIVVGIIALLAAVSIPMLSRARVNANQTSAIAALKAISAAEVSYRTSNPAYGTLDSLVLAQPPYISGFTATTQHDYGSFTYYKQGYCFFHHNTGTGYEVGAFSQIKSDCTGTYCTTGSSFCVSDDGVIRNQPTCDAGANCTNALTPIGQ